MTQEERDQSREQGRHTLKIKTSQRQSAEQVNSSSAVWKAWSNASISVLLQALAQLAQLALEVTSAAHAISCHHPIPIALFHSWTLLTNNITTNLVVLLFSLIRQHRTVLLMGTGADLTSTRGSSWLPFNPEPWHAEEYSHVSLRCSAQSPQHKIWGLKGQVISVFQHYPISLRQE